MQACNEQSETLETKAHLQGKKKSDCQIDSDIMSLNPISDSGSKIGEDELKNISMDMNGDPNEVDCSITRNSRMEEATSNFIGEITATEEEAYFVTGSTYKGSWDALGMAGVGRYVMPNGTVYEGEIRDGMFHGHGSLYWSKNQRLDVVHLRGELQEYKYTFPDGLAYRDADWSYCKFPDRRFYESIKRGLRPGGRSLKTAKQPTKVLPPGCYDTGDGVFDPKTLLITSHDDSTKVLRTPTTEECDWIVKNCRKSWMEPTGYRIPLIENWSDDSPELPYNLAMSQDSPDPWWKRLTTFARDLVDHDKEKDTCSKDEYLELPELCVCGQYVILGEPCRCMPITVPSEIEWQDDLHGERFHGEESNEYHEDNGVECGDTSLESDSVSSIDDSSEYAIGEKIIKGIEVSCNDVSRIDVSADFSPSISGEYPEDSFSEKMIEKSRELRKKSGNRVNDEQLPLDAVEVRLKNEEVMMEDTVGETELQIDAYEKHREIARPKDVVGEEILRQSSNRNHNKNSGKSENFIEQEMQQKSAVESQEMKNRSRFSMEEEKFQQFNEEASPLKIRRREDEVEDEEMARKLDATKKQEDPNARSENFVEKEFLLKSVEEIDKKMNEQPEIIREKEDQGKNGNQNDEEKKSLEVAMENSILHNSPDNGNEDQVERERNMTDESNVIEESIKEKAEVLSIQREIPLENHDYFTTATILREKVLGATEPETANARRTQTKFLSKTTLTKEYDNVSTETGSIEERLERDLRFYRVDAETITCDDEIGIGTSIKFQENIHFESGSKDSPEDNILAEKFVQKKMKDEAEDNKVGQKAVDRMRNELGKKVSIYKSESKASVKSKSKKSPKVSTMSGQIFQNLITQDARIDRTEIFPSKLDEGLQSPMKETLSIIVSKVKMSEKNLTSLKDDPRNLEKSRPSFAILSPIKPKPSNKKEINEIYNKFPRKMKPGNKCSNANVWHLSSALRGDSSQTKTLCHSCGLQRKANTEDLRFGLALITSRSRPVEYGRKPHDLRVRKPTPQEVLPVASSCREEYPFKTSTKPDRFAAKHSCRNKREKK